MMDWKALIGSVAPTLATALGGPLAGLAVKAVGDALGLDKATEESVSMALKGATPDDLLKIKTADQAFQAQMAALNVDLERIAAGDRDSARNREIAVKDSTPAILAYSITAGFFGVLGYILGWGVPKSGGDALLVLLGSLGTAWTGIVAYYYGSSSSSRTKDETIKGMASK